MGKEKSYATPTLYIPKADHEIYEGLKKLADRTGLSMSSVMWVCVRMLYPELKKQLPSKREFKVKINGKEHSIIP